MSTAEEVKEFLKNAIPEARKQGCTSAGLSLFLRNYGIAIKGVDLNIEEKMKPYMCVEFINEENEIEEARFDLAEVDGRPLEEIEKEAKDENV